MKNWVIFLAFSICAGSAHAQLYCGSLYTDRAFFHIQSQQVSGPQIIQTALENLLQKGDLKTSLVIIQKIADTGDLTLDQSQIQILKKTRKYSSLVRSAFSLGTKDHQVPPAFADFVRDFGRLNDLLAEKIPDGIQATASKILKKYKQLQIEKMAEEINSAKKRSIRKYFSELKDETQDLLFKKNVSLEEFHEVRKNLKEFLAYYRFLIEQKGNSLHEYHFLNQLNDDLGLFNDQLTAQVLRGQSRTTDRLAFPPQFKVRILEFLNQLSID